MLVCFTEASPGRRPFYILSGLIQRVLQSPGNPLTSVLLTTIQMPNGTFQGIEVLESMEECAQIINNDLAAGLAPPAAPKSKLIS